MAIDGDKQIQSSQSEFSRGRGVARRLAMLGGGGAVLLLGFLAARFLGPQAATAQQRAPQRSQQPAQQRAPAAPQAPRGPLNRLLNPTQGKPQPAATARRGTVGSQPAPRAAAAAPAVVAVVDGQRISQAELAQECTRRFGKDILESLVNRELIVQECRKRGLQISEQDVSNEINRVAARFGLPTERWLQLLREERDVSEQQYRSEIIWPTLALRKLAAQEIVVSDEELQKAFETHYGPQVRARMIIAGTRGKAEQILQLAKAAPEKFGDLAKTHSEDSHSASVRGMIPPIRKHLGDPELERVAFSLKEGQISPVIEVAKQFVILKCEQQIAESFIPVQHVKGTKDRLRETIADQKMREMATEMFQGMQQNAQVRNIFDDPQLAQQNQVAAVVNGQTIPMQTLATECFRRHGKDVLEGEITRKLLTNALQRAQVTVTDADIDQEVRRAAEAYGYAKNGKVDVNAWLANVTETDGVSVDVYIRDVVWPSVALKKLVHGKVEVTQEDLQKGFESNYGERVQVLAIVCATDREAREVWDKARKDPSAETFGKLAHQYSIEPVSKSNYGRVPPIRKHSGHPHMEKEAFSLKDGELSSVIVSGDKYIVLKCLGRTTPVVEEFAAVKDELTKDITEKKMRVAMAQEYDRLRASAEIANYLAPQSSSAGQASTARRTPAIPAAAPARRPATR